MKISKAINFQDVEGLSRQLRTGKISTIRFSLEIPVNDCANGLYAAYKAIVEYNGGVFVKDNETLNHILKAAEWLTDTNGRPGLMLCGLCGNGKTTLASSIVWLVGYLSEREFGFSHRINIPVMTAKQICRICATNGKEYEKIFKMDNLVIDDLGEEPQELLVYGMIHTPIIDLISERYARRLFTVITTNLETTDLNTRYGERIYDRFREMLTIIGFKNDSYRQKHRD